MDQKLQELKRQLEADPDNSILKQQIENLELRSSIVKNEVVVYNSSNEKKPFVFLDCYKNDIRYRQPLGFLHKNTAYVLNYSLYYIFLDKSDELWDKLKRAVNLSMAIPGLSDEVAYQIYKSKKICKNGIPKRLEYSSYGYNRDPNNKYQIKPLNIRSIARKNKRCENEQLAIEYLQDEFDFWFRHIGHKGNLICQKCGSKRVKGVCKYKSHNVYRHCNKEVSILKDRPKSSLFPYFYRRNAYATNK